MRTPGDGEPLGGRRYLNIQSDWPGEFQVSGLSWFQSANELTVATEGSIMESLPFDDIDLLIFSVTTPLADAVCATACGCWSDAADLWFLVSEDPRYRIIATECGFEAAVLAGEFDLAEYFRIHNGHLADSGVFTESRWTELVSIKAKRTRFFTRTIENTRFGIAPAPVAELIDLRLFKRAIHQVFAHGSYRRGSSDAVRLLAHCYSGLGFHAALIALQSRHPRAFSTPDLRLRYEEASRLNAMRAKATPQIFSHFLHSHPTGLKLSELLDSQGHTRSRIDPGP
jgi:hypothetical protein